MLAWIAGEISIHALRVEGDAFVAPYRSGSSDFYPRPPGGGRPRRLPRRCARAHRQFLSTPSGWRATILFCSHSVERSISIHALRVEGDAFVAPYRSGSSDFYPRPPGGGRPRRLPRRCARAHRQFLSTPSGWRATILFCSHSVERSISIHALRVEGDNFSSITKHLEGNFYPRPPGGGRLFVRIDAGIISRFLSTPSGWRATHRQRCKTLFSEFLSTPSGWRATAKTDKVFVCFCAKGRRICLFKTRKEKICRWRFKKDKFWVLIWCEGSGKSVCALASHCG